MCVGPFSLNQPHTLPSSHLSTAFIAAGDADDADSEGEEVGGASERGRRPLLAMATKLLPLYEVNKGEGEDGSSGGGNGGSGGGGKGGQGGGSQRRPPAQEEEEDEED